MQVVLPNCRFAANEIRGNTRASRNILINGLRCLKQQRPFYIFNRYPFGNIKSLWHVHISIVSLDSTLGYAEYPTGTQLLLEGTRHRTQMGANRVRLRDWIISESTRCLIPLSLFSFEFLFFLHNLLAILLLVRSACMFSVTSSSSLHMFNSTNNASFHSLHGM